MNQVQTTEIDPVTMEQCLGHRVAGKKWVTIAANLAFNLAGIADAVPAFLYPYENGIDSDINEND